MDTPWPKGFVWCRPNGLKTYHLTDEQIEHAKAGDKSYTHGLPDVGVKAITKGPQKWSKVEGCFYRYFYTCTFDPKAKTITTNYTFGFV